MDDIICEFDAHRVFDDMDADVTYSIIQRRLADNANIHAYIHGSARLAPSRASEIS